MRYLLFEDIRGAQKRNMELANNVGAGRSGGDVTTFRFLMVEHPNDGRAVLAIPDRAESELSREEQLSLLSELDVQRAGFFNRVISNVSTIE